MTHRELSQLSKDELLHELRRLQYVEERLASNTNGRDPERLIHDLQVHQVELEMQNVQLREAQELLEESRSRYADLYDFAPIGYCTLDVQGRVEQINLAGASLLGHRRQELVGKPFVALAGLLDKQLFHHHVRDCFRLGRQLTTELRFAGGPGRPTALQIVSTPVRDLDGRITTCRSALIDISAQKQLEGRLRFLGDVGEWLALMVDSQHALAAVARQSVPLLADVCVIDIIEDDGTFRRVEAAFADTTREIKLKSDVMRVAPRLSADTPQTRVFASGEPLRIDADDASSIEASGRDPEHARVMRAMHLRAMIVVPLTARGRLLGTLTLMSCESQRAYTEDDLTFAAELARRAGVALDNAQLYQRTQQAVQTRERLLAIVSHDLRNPLAAILMMASQLSSRMPPQEDRRRDGRRALERICQSARSMNRLIGDLLDSASMEAGHFSIKREDHAADVLLSEAVESLQNATAERTVQLKAGPCAHDQVNCDRERVQQVFTNLVGNALNHTPDGGSITLECERHDRQVVFAVRDTGVGIAPEQLPHLFDRFWQVKRTATLGHGLGLSIAKGIIDAHGGHIWAESAPGEGSAFFFTLPVSAAAVEPAIVPLPAPEPTKAVLLVDDDAEARAALGASLADRGYHVATAANGVEALAYLRRSPPPLAICLDLVMPVMDGWTFLSERNNDPALSTIPVVVISGQPSVEDHVAAANAILMSKPVTPDQIVQVLEHTSH